MSALSAASTATRAASDAAADRAVAVARIGVGAAATLIAVEEWAILGAVADGRAAMPVLTWAPAVTTDLLRVWITLAVLAGVAMTLGLGSRPAAGLMAALGATALLWDQQTYSSHLVLACLLCLYLSFGQPGRAWSLDARLGGPRDLPAGADSPWPRLLITTQITVVYTFSALSKLNGAFLSGDGLRAWMRPDLPERAYPALALLAVVTELFLAVALWSRLTWPAACALGLGLHLSIVATLEGPWPLAAFAVLCLACYPLFRVRHLPGAT